MVEGGQGVMVPDVVTLAVELRDESMAGDWLQVWAPLGLGEEELVYACVSLQVASAYEDVTYLCMRPEAR